MLIVVCALLTVCLNFVGVIVIYFVLVFFGFSFWPILAEYYGLVLLFVCNTLQQDLKVGIISTQILTIVW